MAKSTVKNSQRNDVKHYDAIIVGAGVIGATLALGLAQQKGWQIALIEKSPFTEKPFLENIRATALGLPSQRLLTELDVWQQLEQSQQCAYGKMLVWDENSDSQLSFDAADYHEPCLGWIVDHNAVQLCLQKRLQQSKVECFYESQVNSITQIETITNVEINNQEKKLNLSATWLFAADGVNSQIRSYAGIPVDSHDYHQQGIVAKIRTEKSHQYTAWQRYLSSGSVALLPLSSGECSIVWSAESSQAETLLNLSEQDFAQRLQNTLQSRFGTVELCSKRFAFPLRSVRVEQYIKESIILLGDAAHGIHPMAGQGANLGFADVATLLNEIKNMPAEDNKMHRALRRYERQQKFQNHMMDSFLTSLDTAFRSDNIWLNTIRCIGMKTINDHSSIKSLFAQHVLGKT